MLDTGATSHIRWTTPQSTTKGLYMPSYPNDIISVARAMNGGAAITFKRGNSHMVTKDGNRYYVGVFLSKGDRLQATEKFLADIAAYGEVKCICSDNGTEFMNRDFQALLTKNKIRHETSAPYSPHQNGTAERGWRTLYDISRCLLIESELPDNLWNYAMQTSAYVRNSCYNRRTKKTPYEFFIGKKPDVSKMQKFGSTCFAYKQEKGKLDSRCEQGVFIGYDKNTGLPSVLPQH
ncbi:ribonuclease inhibitor-like [Tachysurus ichikawai]